jgi:putative oxidoreductase
MSDSTTLSDSKTNAMPGGTARGTDLNAVTELIGRLALAAIFLLAGLNKIGAFAGTQSYMESVGVPGMLLPGVIVLEILGAALLIVGLWTRLVALALAAFSVVSGLLFHFDLADQMQFILFFKNIAMAGGFLVLAANGAGSLSLDARRRA